MGFASSLGIVLVVVGAALVVAGIVVLLMRDTARPRRLRAVPPPERSPSLPPSLPALPPRRSGPPMVVVGSPWPTSSGEAARVEPRLVPKPIDALAHAPAIPVASEHAMPADAPAQPAQPGQAGIRLRLTVTGNAGSRQAVRMLTLRGRHIAGRRAPEDALRFPEDATMSARHCELSVERDAVMLRDLDSANGTIVNGVPVRAGQHYRLGDGDVIRIGETELRVAFPEGDRAPDARPVPRDPASREAR